METHISNHSAHLLQYLDYMSSFKVEGEKAWEREGKIASMPVKSRHMY